jgi:quercetin dioxygenase-like cupin family protein
MENNQGSEMSDLPAGQVVKVIDRVAYREGGLAPSIILDRESGSCRVVALDKGQGRSAHTTPFEALVYVLEGEAGITISGEKHHLKPGEMIRIPADAPHALEALTRLKLMSFKIKPND